MWTPTGGLEGMTRSAFADLLEAAGARLASSVTASTYCVVSAGQKSEGRLTGKLKKAADAGVLVLSEEEFWEMHT